MGVAVIAAALAWIGCGSSGSDEGSLTKADFIRKADAVCSEWQQARDQRYTAAASKFGNLNNKANKEKAILYILAPYEVAVEGLGEITPPAGEEDKVDGVVKAMEEAMAQTRKNPVAASEEAPFDKPNKLAESYGLEECKV